MCCGINKCLREIMVTDYLIITLNANNNKYTAKIKEVVLMVSKSLQEHKELPGQIIRKKKKERKGKERREEKIK